MSLVMMSTFCYCQNLEAFLKDNAVTNIDDFIDNFTKYRPRIKNELLIK